MNRRIALWTLALGLLGTAFVQAQEVKTDAPAVIRIGVATGGVGNPIRHGGTSTALAYADKAIEEEFRKDGTKVEWIFFKGAGPAVNEALVNKQLDFAWQGDLPSIVHRAAGVKTKIILGSGVRTGLYLAQAGEFGFVLLSLAQGTQALGAVNTSTRPVVVLSGPEGGLSPSEEAAALAAGFAPVSLGPRVLRAETAPLAVLALLALLA